MTDQQKRADAAKAVDDEHKDCPKCKGDGWLRGHELDDAGEDTVMDTMTKYPCDGMGVTE